MASSWKETAGDRSSPDSESIQKNTYKDPDDGKQRFLLELEFIQCLANPTYIHYLAQNRYFEDEAFIGYLKYLKYWQKPEYVKFIMYPHCLFFLELLQNPNFRNAMAHPGSKEVAHRQQYFYWKNYRNNRLKHILPQPPPPDPLPPVSQSQSQPPSVPVQVPPPMATVGGSNTTLSPMQQFNMRNSTIGDRRKRKKDG